MLNVLSAKGSSLTRFCRREEYSITADVLHMSLLAALLHSRTPSFSQKYTILERFLCDKRKPLSFLAIKERKSFSRRSMRISVGKTSDKRCSASPQSKVSYTTEKHLRRQAQVFPSLSSASVLVRPEKAAQHIGSLRVCLHTLASRLGNQKQGACCGPDMPLIDSLDAIGIGQPEIMSSTPTPVPCFLIRSARLDVTS